MRRAFTLIELLVVVAILGIMVTAGVVSITSGQGAARVRGAARDVVASIRHARSVALVSQQPATIAFSNESSDGGTVARVKIKSVRIVNTNAVTRATTLEGETVNLSEASDESPRSARKTRSQTVGGGDPAVGESSGGEDISDILFSPVSDEVMRGIRLKVLTGEEAETAAGGSGVSSYSTADGTRSRVSVFSTADYINSKYQEQAAREKAEEKTAADSAESIVADDEGSGPASIVWEVNGRTEPHCVWVYRDGMKPEDGLLIRVDRFGAIKVLSGDGKEDED